MRDAIIIGVLVLLAMLWASALGYVTGLAETKKRTGERSEQP